VIQTRTQEEDVMARYLLGELPDAEQEVLEQKLFLDDDWFDRLRVVEMELIDDYVQGNMSAADRAQFEQGFLTTPERAEKVANAKALLRHVAELEPVATAAEPERSPAFWGPLANYFSFQSPAMQYAMTAAVLLLTVGGLWLVYDRVQLQQQLELARKEQAKQASEDRQIREQRAELERELERKQTELQKLSGQAGGKDEEIARLKGEIADLRRRRESLQPGGGGELVTMFLKAPLSRGGGVLTPQQVSVELPARAKRLDLQVQLRSPVASHYEASLKTGAGEPVKEWPAVRPRKTPRGHFLPLGLPVNLLRTQDYLLELKDVKVHALVSAYQIKIVRN
jgi:hypothetical protein